MSSGEQREKVARQSHDTDEDEVTVVASSRHEGRAEVRGVRWRQGEISRVSYSPLDLVSASWSTKGLGIEGIRGDVHLSNMTKDERADASGLVHLPTQMTLPRVSPQQKSRTASKRGRGTVKVEVPSISYDKPTRDDATVEQRGTLICIKIFGEDARPFSAHHYPRQICCSQAAHSCIKGD